MPSGTGYGDLLMRHIIRLLAITAAVLACAFGTEASAQESAAGMVASCNDRSVAGETVTVCPSGLYESVRIGRREVLVRIDTGNVDLRTCRGETLAGMRVIECGTDLYQWVRDGNRLSFVPLPILSGPEADQASIREQYLDGGYRSMCYERFGGLTCLEPWNERNMRENCMNRYGISSRGPLYYQPACYTWRDRYEEQRLLRRMPN